MRPRFLGLFLPHLMKAGCYMEVDHALGSSG